MIPKVGDIVLYVDQAKPVDPRLGIKPENPKWPALVYKIHEEHKYLGLYVYTEDGVRLMRKVSWADEDIPETWGFRTWSYRCLL